MGRRSREALLGFHVCLFQQPDAGPTTVSWFVGFFSPSVDRGVPMRLFLDQTPELGVWGDGQQGSMAAKVWEPRQSKS